MRGRRVGGPGLQARISTSGPQAAAPGRARVPRAIPTSPGSPRTHHGVDGRDPAYKAHRGLRVIFLWNKIRWPLFYGNYAGMNKAPGGVECYPAFQAGLLRTALCNLSHNVAPLLIVIGLCRSPDQCRGCATRHAAAGCAIKPSGLPRGCQFRG